jgi:hypothetical protein
MMFERCRREVASEAALRELGAAEASIRWMRLMIVDIDRDIATLDEAIVLCKSARRYNLAKRLEALKTEPDI